MRNPLGFLVDVGLLSIVSISLESGLLCLTSLLGLVIGSNGVYNKFYGTCVKGDCC
jgi:hypothetical protein